MKFKDYYQILGIEKTAPNSAVKKAYRKLARRYHPDVNPGDQTAELKFKEINEANEVLADPDTRQKYDQLGSNWKQYENAPSSSRGNANWNVNMGGPQGARSLSEDEVREMFGGSPFSDFFHTFFSGQSGPNPNRQPRKTKHRGLDVEHKLEMSLEQAFHGVTQRLLFKSAPGKENRTVEVRIPPGVTDGSRVRLPGKGEPGTGSSNGDLYLRISLKSHPIFECKGHNLYVKTVAPLTTAVLGGHVEVPTVDGDLLRLKIPQSTQPGQVFRLKGRGMPGQGRRTKSGDLYATIHVKIPETLTLQEKTLYKKLATMESIPAENSDTEGSPPSK